MARNKPKNETQIGSNIPVQSSIGKKTAEELKTKGIKSPVAKYGTYKLNDNKNTEIFMPEFKNNSDRENWIKAIKKRFAL